jgi:mRNA-degrading endonuclease RelE of RelBE toxin-antitoxin system
MSYNVVPLDNFKKEAKRLIKKYASLKTELLTLHGQLEENPTLGTLLGNDIYKIRLGIASKSKG